MTREALYQNRDICNDIFFNMKEMNSFGGHFASYICIVTYQVPAHLGTYDVILFHLII